MSRSRRPIGVLFRFAPALVLLGLMFRAVSEGDSSTAIGLLGFFGLALWWGVS